MRESEQQMDRVKAEQDVLQQSDAEKAKQRLADVTAKNVEQRALRDSVDIQMLREQLTQLRKALRNNSSDDPEADISVGGIATAEQAAAKGDRLGVFEGLRVAGKYALETAQKIGVEVAVAAIKSAIGMK